MGEPEKMLSVNYAHGFPYARVTMNARSGACGTGCRSARRWHGRIGAAPIATYRTSTRASKCSLNLNNMR